MSHQNNINKWIRFLINIENQNFKTTTLSFLLNYFVDDDFESLDFYSGYYNEF